MLKSTYQPLPAAAAANAPLQPGWTEHKAPSGHTYYYNASTKTSTYKRPIIETPAAPVSSGPVVPVYPSLATPAAANAFMAQVNPNHFAPKNRNNDRPKHDRPRPQPVDKPRSRVIIPGHEGWFLVQTKYGRRFVYNAVKDASFWRIPEKLKDAIAELDRKEARRKAGIIDPEPENDPIISENEEYEEVEVTDDEDDAGGHIHKRQRTEEVSMDDGPVEFTEEDIMMQLAAMGENAYEGDDGECYDQEGHDEPALTPQDARALFRDLLSDYRISPYSPWDVITSDSRILDDARYLALSTTRERKECWDEWTREQISAIKARRATEEKADPRLAYVGFLSENASTKLFWPEFKRKFRKEAVMTDRGMSDKDREKLYREFVGRLKMSRSQLKSDLTAFLKSQPLAVLNNQTDPKELPPAIRIDVRYASVPSAVRDPLVGVLIQSLPSPPQGNACEQTADMIKETEARKRREKALEENRRRAQKRAKTSST